MNLALSFSADYATRKTQLLVSFRDGTLTAWWFLRTKHFSHGSSQGRETGSEWAVSCWHPHPSHVNQRQASHVTPLWRCIECARGRPPQHFYKGLFWWSASSRIDFRVSGGTSMLCDLQSMLREQKLHPITEPLIRIDQEAPRLLAWVSRANIPCCKQKADSYAFINQSTWGQKCHVLMKTENPN